MLATINHAVLYAISFVAMLTLFATAIGLLVWLCMMGWRAISRL